MFIVFDLSEHFHTEVEVFRPFLQMMLIDTCIECRHVVVYQSVYIIMNVWDKRIPRMITGTAAGIPIIIANSDTRRSIACIRPIRHYEESSV
jgi:hypothetical protein